MSNASKHRKKAVEFEQLKQFDRAVASYVRAIEENESAGEEVDVALFNKVGDLTLRQGRVTEAVTYYERAVEHYASNGLFDNAIALCNKILRNAPGRSNVYFTLGRICGKKGLRSDATRNFLEYATRMQQDGRVEEGMRALAEVADLMPELTEVGRLVQEHAERAGITLPQRKRTTPPRSVAQPVLNAAGNSFGLSKDLVFLDIEYDGPRSARAKTPAPVRAVAAPRLATPPVAPKAIEAPASDVAVEANMATVLVDDATAAAEIPFAEVASVNSTVAEASRTLDLQSFEALNAEHARSADSDDARAIIDGATILTPFVDPATPLPMLPDLEPTEFNGTPRYTLAISTQRPLPDLLLRGVAPKVEGVTELEAAPVVVRVPTVPHSRAIVREDAVVNASLEDDGRHERDAVLVVEPLGETESRPTADAVVAESTSVVASTLTDEPSALDADAAIVVDNPRTEAASTPPANTVPVGDEMVVADVELVYIDAIEGDSGLIELEDTETADATDAPVPVNFVSDTNELVFLEPIADDFGALDGFTAEESLHSRSAHNSTELPAIVPEFSDAEQTAPVVIDFDAMLGDAAPPVSQIGDIEFEEFAPSNNELAATRFVRVESDELPALNDAFEAADELSPLIFPLPFDVEPFNAPEERSSNDDAFFMPEELEAGEFGSDALETGEGPDEQFGVTPFELPNSFDSVRAAEQEGSSDAPIEDALDASYDETFDPGVELPFIVPHDALETNVYAADAFAASAFAADELNDLDDLFTDGDVPTAVVAAEAAAVATSRRDELNAAVAAEPGNWTLRRRLAEALFEAGERAAAMRELEAAMAGFERANELASAAEIADDLVRVAGEQVGYHQKRVELAIRLGDQNRLRDAYLDLADNLVRNSDDLRARAVYARVLEIDPWDDRARAALGDAAPPAPVRVVPGSDDSHVDLAEWLRDDDEPQSTRLRMREPEASGNEQDDFNSLLRQFKQGVARSLGEDDHDSHYDLGVAYKEMGLLDDAIGEFQKALRSRNNRLAAYEALGQCFLEQQSYKVAVTVLSRALHEPAVRDDQRVGVLYLLGYSCEALQRFDEARGYFERVYATDTHFRDVDQRLAALDRIAR